MKRRDVLKIAPVAIGAALAPTSIMSNTDRLDAALEELKQALKAVDPKVTGLMVLRDGQGDGQIIGAMAVTT